MTALMMLLIALVTAVPGHAADVAAGRKVFARCRICHRVEAGAPKTAGPNLHGLFGRKAGTLAGFNYSKAMKASGLTWDDGTLAKYLRDPKSLIPGNRMAFPGIAGDAEIANLLAYLRQATK